jgi:arsenate reductase (thioredoxin)
MTSKTKVLFVCIHNSARSQMAEAFLNQEFGDSFEAESAGLEPGALNPFVVRSMQDAGIDISGNSTDSVNDLLQAGKQYDYVITVCDGANSERCPVFPSAKGLIKWEFPDPSQIEGAEEEKLQNIATIRDSIKNKVKEWGKEISDRLI